MAEFVEYFALLKEMPAGAGAAAVATAVERVDLGDKARAKLRTLSGGMLRRVGIAQAIVNEPELLLLDEPTAGLDPEQRVTFRALLRDLGQRATVVVSTHLVEDVGAACIAGRADGPGQDRLPRDAGRADRPGRGHRHGGDAPLERGYSARARGGPGMTASAPAAPRPAAAGAAPGPRSSARARLLRLELRHNADARGCCRWSPALFWFNAYREIMALPPMWNAARHDHAEPAAVRPRWSPATGAAAWMGSREGRREHRPTWWRAPPGRAGSRQLATWAATTAWAVVGYLACVAVVYVVTARQASWGGAAVVAGRGRRGGRARR